MSFPCTKEIGKSILTTEGYLILRIVPITLELSENKTLPNDVVWSIKMLLGRTLSKSIGFYNKTILGTLPE